MPSSKGIDKKKGVKPWKWQASVRKRVEKKSAHRAPASILSLKDKEEIKLNKNFEKTFLKSFNSQARHPQEVNQLIDDLKSYKNDYTKNY